MSAFLQLIVSIVFLAGWAEAGEFRIDVYDATDIFSHYFIDERPIYEVFRSMIASIQQLRSFRTIYAFNRNAQITHNCSDRYCIQSTSEEQRSPEMPGLTNPTLRVETLKSASAPLRKRIRNQNIEISGHSTDLNLPRRTIEITRINSTSFLVKNTSSNGKQSYHRRTEDPLLMIAVLVELEDCPGRRDVRYSKSREKWVPKNNDERVTVNLSKSIGAIREGWNRAFFDGILGIDEGWSIYAVVMSSEPNMWWNHQRTLRGRQILFSHQAIIGFLLADRQTNTYRFIQITNWTNDPQHIAYQYCDPETSALCPLVTESGDQVDADRQWTPDIIIHPAIRGSFEEKVDTLPTAYCNPMIWKRKDNDEPQPPGAAGCSGGMVQSAF